MYADFPKPLHRIHRLSFTTLCAAKHDTKIQFVCTYIRMDAYTYIQYGCIRTLDQECVLEAGVKYW